MKGRGSDGGYRDDIQAMVEAAGRENREIVASVELYEKLGHEKRNLLHVIRDFCVDCMGGQPSYVRKCTSVGCALWPYRLRSNPFRAEDAKKGKPVPAFQRKEEP